MTIANAGHAFICYVREDAAYADAIEKLLADAGIPFWRDTHNLWPGEDWREKIREAITEGAFAFIPIFSDTSVAKGVSGQNEELYLAADEMRKRQPGASWMFPVRFDDCRLPRIRLGGDRTLDSIQRADLFGDDATAQASRLVEAIRRITAASTSELEPDAADSERALATTLATPLPRAATELKGLLRDPNADIRLHDLIIPIADATFDELVNTSRYPTDGSATFRQIADQIDDYWTDLRGMRELFIVGAPWSRSEHAQTWTEVVERIGRAGGSRSGNIARVAARWFPVVSLVYSGILAALYRDNYVFVKATAIDAQVRDGDDQIAAVARSSAWQPFDAGDLAAQILALEASGELVDDSVIAELQAGRKGKRYTPGSDFLHDRLRPEMISLYPDDADFSNAFDRAETTMALLTTDLDLQTRAASDGKRRGPYVGGPTPGRASWRERHTSDEYVIEARMRQELQVHGMDWPPLAAGLFGGSIERAEAAFDAYAPVAAKARSSRW